MYVPRGEGVKRKCCRRPEISRSQDSSLDFKHLKCPKKKESRVTNSLDSDSFLYVQRIFDSGPNILSE